MLHRPGAAKAFHPMESNGVPAAIDVCARTEHLNERQPLCFCEALVLAGARYEQALALVDGVSLSLLGSAGECSRAYGFLQLVYLLSFESDALE